MWRIGVLDSGDGFIDAASRRFDGVRFERCDGMGGNYDAIVITDNAPAIEVAAPTVLLPSARRGVLADSVITYGMSTHDTATLSSVSNDSVVVSFQRDFTSLGGRTVPRQEFGFSWVSATPQSCVSEALPLAVLQKLIDR